MKPSSPGWATETTCATEEEGAQVEASTGFFCGEVAGCSESEDEEEEEEPKASNAGGSLLESGTAPPICPAVSSSREVIIMDHFGCHVSLPYSSGWAALPLYKARFPTEFSHLQFAIQKSARLLLLSLESSESSSFKRVALEKYLTRLVAHPVIRKSNELRAFLQVQGKLLFPKQLLNDSMNAAVQTQDTAQPARVGRDLLKLFKELK
ncbi:unnamed protein product [Cuscuta campestris]|uniref:PX domain-containing protein n=1 Tax=Cuscuta campestris TaxID=132261 RepID=A0A484LKN9_9ASTE|nr:unnamed protein product [Cuscuta campestris]